MPFLYNGVYSDRAKCFFPVSSKITHSQVLMLFFICFNTMFLCISHSHLQPTLSSFICPYFILHWNNCIKELEEYYFCVETCTNWFPYGICSYFREKLHSDDALLSQINSKSCFKQISCLWYRNVSFQHKIVGKVGKSGKSLLIGLLG